MEQKGEKVFATLGDVSVLGKEVRKQHGSYLTGSHTYV